MIEIIELPELTALGVMVEASPAELPRAIAAAWTRLFETDTGATNFLRASISEEGGICRELLGYLAAQTTEVPPGLVRLPIPAGRYLRFSSDGPLDSIREGFARLHAHAAANALSTTGFQLDFGYSPGLAPGRHELHLALAPEILRLA